MATIRNIISGALRKIGITGSGQQPSLQEYADALEILQSLIRGLITSGAFGRMRDVVPQDNYVAGENERVFRRYSATLLIELPDMVSCRLTGSCDYGQRTFSYAGERPPRDNAVVTIVDELTGGIEDYIYDGQRKAWFAIYDMAVDYDPDDSHTIDLLNHALDMECPLSHRDPNGLKAYLAMMLADDFGANIPEMTSLQARDFRLALSHAYSNRDWR